MGELILEVIKSKILRNFSDLGSIFRSRARK